MDAAAGAESEHQRCARRSKFAKIISDTFFKVKCHPVYILDTTLIVFNSFPQQVEPATRAESEHQRGARRGCQEEEHHGVHQVRAENTRVGVSRTGVPRS